jgi:hypothetical protein
MPNSERVQLQLLLLSVNGYELGQFINGHDAVSVSVCGLEELLHLQGAKARLAETLFDSREGSSPLGNHPLEYICCL